VECLERNNNKICCKTHSTKKNKGQRQQTMDKYRNSKKSEKATKTLQAEKEDR
jgi:hypothetical protein